MATPLKVKIITWLAVHEMLPTSLYLHKHHIKPLSLCTFCGNHSESSTCIFLSSGFAQRIWASIVTRLDLPSSPASLQHLWRTDGLHTSLERPENFETSKFKSWFGPFELEASQEFLTRKRFPQKRLLKELFYSGI